MRLPPDLRRACLLAVVVSAFMVPLGGCMDPVENRATDNQYLRAPGEKPAHMEVPDKPVFPLSQGSRWEMALRSGDKMGTEIVDANGTEQVGGRTGTVMEQRQNGDVYRQEIYAVDPKGVWLLAAVTKDKAKNKLEKMTMNPPIALIHLPIKEGEFTPWEGVLNYQNTSAPGTALSRIGSPEKVKTLAGSFVAYRIDTIITTTIQGKQVSFPTTRWVAPGVGIIKQKLLAGNTILYKELKSYKIAGN